MVSYRSRANKVIVLVEFLLKFTLNYGVQLFLEVLARILLIVVYARASFNFFLHRVKIDTLSVLCSVFSIVQELNYQFASKFSSKMAKRRTFAIS